MLGEGMTDFPGLETDRLILRAFVRADGPAVERLAGAWPVADTTLTIPHPYPEGAGALWIDTHAPAWNTRKHLTLAVCLVEAPQELVGAIGLSLEEEHANAELGYWIDSAMWGRGYATEAARAIVSFGFASLGLHRIQARHFLRNAASGRVMQKIGMRLEGVHRGAYRRWGRFEDVAVYAILAPEWQQMPHRSA